MSTKQRRDQIMARLYEVGHVEVRELSTSLAISEATVRRDLRLLADEGSLELVYGGATLPRASDFSFLSRTQRNIDAKRVVGRLAAELVQDCDQLYLDSGTTCFEMCPYLRSKRGLSIVVNSVRLVTELGNAPNLSIIMLGGQYRCDRMDVIGPLSSTMIDQLRGYRAFIGADGLSMDFGVTAGDIDTAHLNRQVMRNAREVILIVDHTKFLTPSLFKQCDFDAISRVITDHRPSPEWEAFLQDEGIEVLFPDADVQHAQA